MLALRSLLEVAVCRYPVTLADFFLADVTDSMLDGYIAGFPNTYASKVGKVRLPSALVTPCSRKFLFFCRTDERCDVQGCVFVDVQVSARRFCVPGCFASYMSMHCSSSDRLLFLECCCRVHHGTLVFLGCAFQYSRAAQCRNPEASPCLLEVHTGRL